MLSKIIVKIFSALIEVALWLILLVGLIVGWQLYDFWGSIIGLIVAAIFGATFFGYFLIISEIRKSVERIESKKE